MLKRKLRATIDFETRSACDLLRRGAWLYSRDKTTQILCLAYKVPGMKEPGLWHRAHPGFCDESPPPKALFDWIASGGLVEAHNAFFEQMVWRHVAQTQHGWPEIPEEQWRCSAAKSAAHALPRELGAAGRALGLKQLKSVEGARAMRAVSQPRKLTKAEQKSGLFDLDELIWNENPILLKQTWEYCRQDVRAEECLSEAVPDLDPREYKIWLANQRANERGIRIDVELATTAIKMAHKTRLKLNAELHEITAGAVDAATKRQKFHEWLAENGCGIPDTRADTLDYILNNWETIKQKEVWVEGRKTTPPEHVRRAIEIVRTVNRTSVNKYKRMLENIDTDNKTRELIKYCGAERTGRFSGQGIQVHNLPKGNFEPKNPDAFPWNVTMDQAVADIKSGNLEWCELLYGDVMGLLASALRGALMPNEGRVLWVADYSAIEARVVLWLSGATAALDVFRSGGDIYCDMASGIYGREVTKADKQERQFGKQAVLGLGYGMGWIKFLLTCRVYNIKFSRADVLRIMGNKRMREYEAWVRKRLWPDEEAQRNTRVEAKRDLRKLTDAREDPKAIIHELALMKYTVDVYRARYPEVKELWNAQEKAAIRAVRTGGKVQCGEVVWYVEGRFLYCRLPSGRRLCYVDPEIKAVKTSWGEMKPSLRYMGIDQKTRKWTRQASYGGKLVENITQAAARDVMADAMVYVDEHETYDLLITVHDELVAESDEGKGSEEEYSKLITQLAPYFAGCPITAEATQQIRYRK